MSSKSCTQSLVTVLVPLFLVTLAITSPRDAQAGMGMGSTAPKWHPQPCEGEACKGDDPRSGLPCQGLLCTFSSAKSLQPPTTNAARAASPAPAAVAAATPSAGPSVADAKPKTRKIARKRQKADKEKVARKLDARDAESAAGSARPLASAR